MKRFISLMIVAVAAFVIGFTTAGKRACTYKVDGKNVTLQTSDGISGDKARQELSAQLDEQQRIDKCIADGGDEEACWFNTTTYIEDPETCGSDMECFEKYGHDCYIVRDVISGDGNEYMLEWLALDGNAENFKYFASYQEAEDVANDMYCMDLAVVTNCFMSSRETCENVGDSWDESKDYIKWHINNGRRISGKPLLK